jgi:hypothetical protein
MGMAVPEVQRDRTAHRIANEDHRPQPELLDQGGRVVGGVLEPEGSQDVADATTVPAMVNGDERVRLRQRLVGGEELQVGGRRPAVEE